MLSALPRLVLHHNGRSRLLSKYWDVAVHPVSWLIDLEKVSPWTSSLGQQQGRDSGCVLPRRLDKHFLWQANHSHRKEPLLVLGSLAGLTPQPRIGFFHAEDKGGTFHSAWVTRRFCKPSYLHDFLQASPFSSVHEPSARLCILLARAEACLVFHTITELLKFPNLSKRR